MGESYTVRARYKNISGLTSYLNVLVTRILVPRSWYQARSWYQKKRRAREAEPLGMQEGTGGCKLPARGSGGLEAPQEQQEVWGAAAPQ